MSLVPLQDLPAPDLVQEIDYTKVLEQYLDDFTARQQAHDASYSRPLPSDPAYQTLAVVAYKATLLRQAINDAGRAVMPAYARGADLDHLALFYRVRRLQIRAADPDANPPVSAAYESDAALRERMLLALDGLSVAGPERAYIYHALSADGRVLDASAKSPKFRWVERQSNGNIVLECIDDAGLAEPVPGDVVVTILARDNDGVASPDLIATVEAALSDETVRPLADHVIVQSAEMVDFAVEATLYVYEGPDAQVIVDNAQAAIERYTHNQHRLGLDVTLSGIYAALHQPGVQRVELELPGSTYTISRQQAPRCTGIDITYGGVDE